MLGYFLRVIFNLAAKFASKLDSCKNNETSAHLIVGREKTAANCLVYTTVI